MCKTTSFRLNETASFRYKDDSSDDIEWKRHVLSFLSERQVVRYTRTTCRSVTCANNSSFKTPDDTPFASTLNDSAHATNDTPFSPRHWTTGRLLPFLISFHFSFKSLFHLIKYTQIIFKLHQTLNKYLKAKINISISKINFWNLTIIFLK